MTYPKLTASQTAAPIGKPGQTVRGGYLIARRHKESGILVRIASRPFEHGSRDEAEAEAHRLAERHGDEFTVFVQIASVMPSDRVTVEPPTAETPAPDPMPRPAVIVERRRPRHPVTGGRA